MSEIFSKERFEMERLKLEVLKKIDEKLNVILKAIERFEKKEKDHEKI